MTDRSGSKKKRTAIVFGLTSNHIFAVACVMMDLKRVSPGISDEIVIFYDKELKKRDKALLNRILPSRFIKYDFPISDMSIFNQGTLNYFSKMVFSKFECLRLLDEYENVLWLDYDILIVGDISELIKPSESGIKMMPSPGCPVRNQLHEPVNDYDMDAEANCASTFVFQDNLKNYQQLYAFCYAKLEQYAKYLYCPEQAIFDFMIQEFKLQIVPLDYKVYSPHPLDEDIENAKILHAFGQPKFWNGLKNKKWTSNYKLWRKFGGTGFESSFKEIIRRKVLKVKYIITSAIEKTISK
jgi:lipopolysaccharide biosynthesis glycosyltransferase